MAAFRGWPLFRRERAKFLSLFRWERGKLRENFEISLNFTTILPKFRQNFDEIFVKPRKRAEISQKSRNKGQPQAAFGSVRIQASSNFPVLGPISEFGDYYRLIGHFSVISIGHTSKIFPTATGFLVSASGFRVLVTSTKSSRPARTHQSPASCPRMYISRACLYCPLLAPPHPPGPLPTRPLLSTTLLTTLPIIVLRCFAPAWSSC